MSLENIVIIDNPLAKHYLTILRDKNTSPRKFREYLRKLGFIVGYEASRSMKWRRMFVETPLARAEGCRPGKPVIIVGILGASIPFVEGLWEAIPWAGLGLVAARRVESGREIDVEVYYERLPNDLGHFTIIIADPMLATGKTLVSTIQLIKKREGRDIVVATIISSKYGLEYLMSKEPGVTVYTVAVDPILNDKFFIVPGLGDAGDRGLGYE